MIGIMFNSQLNNDIYDPGIFLFTASSNLHVLQVPTEPAPDPPVGDLNLGPAVICHEDKCRPIKKVPSASLILL
jgi:hypothetical protein